MPDLWRLTGRYFRQHTDRDDALQDALLAAIRGLDGFEGRCRLGTWLHRLTVNACLMKRRREGRRERRERAAAQDVCAPRVGGLDPSDAVHQAELTAAVRAAIDDLSDDFRAVLELRQAGNDVAGCAIRLGISPDLVKVRSHRARAVLRPRLQPFASRTL